MADEKKTVSTEFTDEEKAAIEKLRTEHGRVHAFKMRNHGLFVIRKPSRTEWRKYRSDKSKSMVDPEILDENFFKGLVVSPPPPAGGQALDALFEDYPGMVEPLGHLVSLLATGEGQDATILGKD